MPSPHGKKMKKRTRSEKISIQDLLRACDYGRWDHPTTLRAFRLMKELNKWFSENLIPDSHPLVHIVVSEPCIALCVGDICIWDSECSSQDDLTIEFCKERYKEEVRKLSAILDT